MTENNEAQRCGCVISYATLPGASEFSTTKSVVEINRSACRWPAVAQALIGTRRMGTHDDPCWCISWKGAGHSPNCQTNRDALGVSEKEPR